MKECPCGWGHPYRECCGKYLEEKLFPETPEALMRSRYTAFVNNRLDYIEQTMSGPALRRYQEQGTKSATVEWCGLEVVQAFQDPENSAIGYVEFIAHYRSNGVDGILHEKSQFQYDNHQWFYVDGQWIN